MSSMFSSIWDVSLHGSLLYSVDEVADFVQLQ